MTVRDLRITADVRLSMALRMAPKYMKPGAREAAEALFNDPMFLGGTIAGISLYLGLWVLPEPFFTKAAAIMTTISLIAVAGFTATEILALARAWMRLRDETARARTLRELEGAASRFGKKLGGTSLRVLLALATAVAGKVLPAGGAASPGVAAVSPGGAAVASVSASGMLVKVQGGVVSIVTGAVAMSAMHGNGSGASGGGSGGKPAAAKPRPKYKSFTDDNFRENLGRLTGGIPEGAHAHHVLPVEFAKRLNDIGINIHEPRFGAWWAASAHLKATQAYNREWREFMRTAPSAEQVLQFGRAIASKYGLKIYF